MPPAASTARSYIAQPLYAYVMPWERSVDIDTELDWLVAEAMLKSRQDAAAPCE
jgi:CMP-N-acetylneuraminic acid synthetase